MSKAMPVAGSVERDGFRLTYVPEGSGIPMLVLGAPRYYLASTSGAATPRRTRNPTPSPPTWWPGPASSDL